MGMAVSYRPIPINTRLIRNTAALRLLNQRGIHCIAPVLNCNISNVNKVDMGTAKEIQNPKHARYVASVIGGKNCLGHPPEKNEASKLTVTYRV